MLCQVTFKLADFSCIGVFQEAQTEDGDIVVVLTSHSDSFCGDSKTMFSHLGSIILKMFHTAGRFLKSHIDTKSQNSWFITWVFSYDHRST